MGVEYFPPGAPSSEAGKQEQSLVPANALARRESRPPPPSMDGLVKVVITMADGTELELRSLVSVGYSIQMDDGSTTARLDLIFDEVSYAERVK